ncbi:MAG TPA: periplasmic heavy metal sensor [Burkholderiales bacterium]|nr:periplasmic heavy metal sensor [Burkholderiales bacterium]
MSARHAVNAGLLVAAALFAGATSAQVPGGPHGPEGMGPEGMGPMRGFDRLHKELKLNAQQDELWKKAEAAQRDALKAMQAMGVQGHANLKAEIEKPGVDLKQFAELRDQLRERMHTQMEATRKQVRTAWFGVYDSLDATQREQVRVAIRDGMDRMGHRGRQGGGPMGEMHGGHFGHTAAGHGEG